MTKNGFQIRTVVRNTGQLIVCSASQHSGVRRSVARVCDLSSWPSGDSQLRRQRLARADQSLVQGGSRAAEHVATAHAQRRVSRHPVGAARRQWDVRVRHWQRSRHSRIAANQRHRRLFVT